MSEPIPEIDAIELHRRKELFPMILAMEMPIPCVLIVGKSRFKIRHLAMEGIRLGLQLAMELKEYE